MLKPCKICKIETRTNIIFRVNGLSKTLFLCFNCAVNLLADCIDSDNAELDGRMYSMAVRAGADNAKLDQLIIDALQYKRSPHHDDKCLDEATKVIDKNSLSNNQAEQISARLTRLKTIGKIKFNGKTWDLLE